MIPKKAHKRNGRVANMYNLFVLIVILTCVFFVNVKKSFSSINSGKVSHLRPVSKQLGSPVGYEHVSTDASSGYLAYEQSFGLIDDITDRAWELMRQRVRDTPHYKDPDQPMLYGEKHPNIWYQRSWEPDFSCLHERRIGGMGDGPNWVCNVHRIAPMSQQREAEGGGKCLIYSVGSQGNFMFEKGLQSAVGEGICEIHIFDPDDYSAQTPPNMHFHNWGIESSQSRAGPDFKSLQETVKILGHEGRTIDAFKIDCEGCEWNTYNDWFASGVTLRQILVETHWVPRSAPDFFETLRKEGFVIFHKEPNIISDEKIVEYAFLRLGDAFFQA